jgi:hypothetical protein
MPSGCAEHLRLANTITVATAEIYKAKAAYDSAKVRKAENELALQLALGRATDSERSAFRALAAHVRAHHCQA